MPDVVDLIKAQHKAVDALLEQAQSAEGTEVRDLLVQVRDLLVPHSDAEESFVYPAIRERDASETSQVKDGVAEHHHIDFLLKQLLTEKPGGPGYDGKLAAFVGELRHHVEEEENDLLPVLKEKATPAERESMGARFMQQTGDDGSAVGPGSGGPTKQELYEKAKEQGIEGRSTMTKDELAKAVDADS